MMLSTLFLFFVSLFGDGLSSGPTIPTTGVDGRCFAYCVIVHLKIVCSGLRCRLMLTACNYTSWGHRPQQLMGPLGGIAHLLLFSASR